jgi:hypothetical protein
LPGGALRCNKLYVEHVLSLLLINIYCRLCTGPLICPSEVLDLSQITSVDTDIRYAVVKVRVIEKSELRSGYSHISEYDITYEWQMFDMHVVNLAGDEVCREE